MRNAYLLAAIMTACGGGSSEPTRLDAPSHVVDGPTTTPRCEALGSGSLNTSVGGAPQGVPIQTARVTVFAGAPTIVLAQTSNSEICSNALSAAGDYLDIYVCTKAMGEYPLPNSFPTCPSSMGGARLTMTTSGTSDLAFGATSGTLTIDSVDATCTTGTFNIEFGSSGTATGAFAASACP